jgi:hypothetical protein
MFQLRRSNLLLAVIEIASQNPAEQRGAGALAMTNLTMSSYFHHVVPVANH